ncbi:MAG: 2-phosphosulfolactate phosphatase [Chitinophagaceae bacterium]|jgi:2-phosphosulfolactate phosphatase|nr:2-phosphosulfolactate phosphatase [Chitinophagaceae bacterium]
MIEEQLQSSCHSALKDKAFTFQTVLSPALLPLYDLSNSVFVVIDVFRATSTIAAALYNGAKKVIPVLNVQECIEKGKLLDAVTAGERDGNIIEGLQHGNSPLEYPRSFIEGNILVITTTNGTKMLKTAIEKGAGEVITGSFPNLSAVCDYLMSSNKNVVLGCSGWKDKFNVEDTLFAGAVIKTIGKYFTIHCDSSLMAKEMYEAHELDMYQFAQKATHWHRLAAHGLEKDMEFCIAKDVANVLPVYKNGELIAVQNK